MNPTAMMLDFSDFFEELAKSHTPAPCDGFGLDHVKRVRDLAWKIQDHHGGDWAVIQAAALLHHVGGSDETQASGGLVAERVELLLNETQYDDSFVSEVTNCISQMPFACHAMVKTREAQVLWDANQLEWLGMTGLARLFVRAGKVGAPLLGLDASMAPMEDPFAPHQTSVQAMVFYVSSRMSQSMFTEVGRGLASQRFEMMEAFFARIAAERFAQR